MEECLFIHPDNIAAFRRNYNLTAAVIARPDNFMQQHDCRHLIVETLNGIHTRCYLAEHEGQSFLIIYGRFDRIRKTSRDIDFKLTQEVISFLGINYTVGTFVVGSVKKNDRAGSIYIPHDYVGLGGFNQSRNLQNGFRNVDMFVPFCPDLRQCLIVSAEKSGLLVNIRAVYACFHGYPRIETGAELAFYEHLGWDIVGQTLDPEATLAREAGCHYAAIAVTIDDQIIRSRFLANDPTARPEIDQNIVEGRKRTFSLFLSSLTQITTLASHQCNCEHQATHVKTRSKNFYYRPSHLCEE